MKIVILILLALIISACATNNTQECKKQILDHNLNNLGNVEYLWEKLCI